MDIKKALFLNKELYLEIILNYNQTNWLDISGFYLEKGFKIIHLTNLNQNDNYFLNTAKTIRQLTSFYNSLLIIQDRADIALLSAADGIILTDNSINLDDCKKLVNKDMIIGRKYFTDNDCFDFFLTDKEAIGSTKPVYHKISSDNNIITYKLGVYDYN